MATRLYLANAAPGYTPTAKRGAWDNSSASLANWLAPLPGAAAATAAVAETSATNNYDVLLGRWISDPMDRAGTLSGTVEWIMGALESNTNANMFWHVHIWITKGNTDAVRGTALANSIGATEWPTTATARGEGAKTLTDVDCEVGDRVVVEIGYQAQNTVTTSYTGTVNYGNSGTTDLASGNTGANLTGRPGWIEFSDPAGLLRHHTEKLTDNFDDNSVDTGKWPFNYGTYSESSGKAQVSAVNGGAFSAYESVAVRSIADSHVLAQVTPPPLGTSAWTIAAVTLYDIPSSYNTFLRAYVQNGGSGTAGWGMYCQVAGVSQFDLFTAAVLPDDQEFIDSPWLRLTESGGTVSFDISTDGVEWFSIVTPQTTPTAVRNSGRLTVDLEAWRASTGTGGAATFDNLNLPPVPVVDAGADATAELGVAFTRTADETGTGITARGWTIVDGPVGVGATIDTDAALSWVPGASLAGSNDPRQPTFEEISYELTSTAENSRLDWYSTDVYGYIEDIHDERGYTAGIVGFCSGTGDMLELIEHYVGLNPSTPMAAYVDELTTLAAEGQGPNAGTRADALLGSTFRDLWASLAVSDPLFRRAQRDIRDEHYWEPALAQALADGVGPLGLAILYDISVNHGPGDDEESFGGIVETAQTASPPPSAGGDEAAYLNALVDAREDVLISWGEDPGDLATGRVGAHRALITSGNLTLTAPIEWEMYTDPFEITTRPDPPDDVVAGVYTLRYTATNNSGSDTDDMILTVGTAATIDGTAELVGPALTLGASGLPTVGGAAAFSGPGLGLAAAGTPTVGGAAALTGPALSLTGSGTPTVLGSATLAGPSLTLAATGLRTVGGVAALDGPALALSAAGLPTVYGVAALVGPALTLGAAGSLATPGVVALAGPALALTALAHPVGVAALAGPALELAAEGLPIVAGAASLPGPALTLTAPGTPIVGGSATLAGPALTLAAEAHPVGVVALPGPALTLSVAGLPTVHATAALAGPALDLSVEALGVRLGDAVLSGPGLSLSAAGLPTVHAAAALAGPALSLTAAGVRATVGTVALVGPALGLSASGLRTTYGAAALVGPGLVLSAAGLPTVYGAAALAGPGLTLAVAGVRTGDGAAVLVGPELTLETSGESAPTTGGTGTVTLGALALTVAGVRTTPAAALFVGPPLALAAAGVPTRPGTAALELGALLLAASGTRTVPGSAQLQLGGLALSVAGLGTTPGFGDALLQLGALALHAIGTRKPPQGSWNSLRPVLEQRVRPDQLCPDCGTRLRHVRGVWHCSFDGYTTRTLTSL